MEVSSAKSYVDLIWKSLREEDGLAGNAGNLGTNITSKIRYRVSDKRNEMQYIVKDLYRKFDIDAITPNNVTSNIFSCAIKPEIDEVFIESSSDFLSDTDHRSVILFSDHDSDDDQDFNTDDLLQEKSKEDFRIERLRSLLSSGDLKTRIASLSKLKGIINTLLGNCNVAPKLEIEANYEVNLKRFNLERNLPLVSDMAASVSYQNFGGNHQQLNIFQTIEDKDENDKKKLRRDKTELLRIIDSCGSSLFRLIGDKSEKCRTLSIECMQSLLLADIDISKHIPYMIPAIVARFPTCTYDKDLEVFVRDSQSHDFFRRGGAIARQDKDRLLSHSISYDVIEPNEELRTALCRTISCLVRGLIAKNALILLDSYYCDIICSLQTGLADPFPEVKVESCLLLVQLLRISHWEPAAKKVAAGLARATLPNCRHRNSQVILAAIDLLETSISVPDMAKYKGAGSSAIADLVGFREENVLPIAAFYDSKYNVSVNTLAELSSSRNQRVRKRCCMMLSNFMIYLPDRYDHQQRLLPYILSFINDGTQDIRDNALDCIEKCGVQYESAHPDLIIERRQLGIDGDCSIDYDKWLPSPFTRRPSLGARLFVRSNTSRFILAALDELSNLKDEIRKRSSDLLLIIIVYCEEHMTKHFHHIIMSIAKGIEIEMMTSSGKCYFSSIQKIGEVVCLLSKFIDISAYLPLICPRISGDASTSTSNAEDGCHSEKSRSSYVIILASLIRGSSLHQLMQHWQEIVQLLTSSNCIGPFAGTRISTEATNACSILTERMMTTEGMNLFMDNLKDVDMKFKAQAILHSCSESLMQCNDNLANECCTSFLKLISFLEQN